VPPKVNFGAAADGAAVVEEVAFPVDVGEGSGVSDSTFAKDESFGADDAPNPLGLPAPPNAANGEEPVASLPKPDAAKALAELSVGFSEADVVDDCAPVDVSVAYSTC
jgi:hypothetical protein